MGNWMMEAAHLAISLAEDLFLLPLLAFHDD
jgi:hypothetical protein